jgi:hypothetical protein
LQQLQAQNGEHKSFCLSWECSSLFEANSGLVCAALFTSISAQGKQESTSKMIDNMVFVCFTAVKVVILFLLLLIISSEC